MAHGIRRFDHPLRFYVPSQTRHKLEHLVDLAAYDGAGKCTCEHYIYRCEPELSRGAQSGPLLRCNHIEQARDHFLGLMIKQILEHMPIDADGDHPRPR